MLARAKVGTCGAGSGATVGGECTLVGGCFDINRLEERLVGGRVGSPWVAMVKRAARVMKTMVVMIFMTMEDGTKYERTCANFQLVDFMTHCIDLPNRFDDGLHNRFDDGSHGSTSHGVVTLRSAPIATMEWLRHGATLFAHELW